MRTELENQALREELAELTLRLNESENMLQAIRSGAVDAIVVDTSAGEQFFMLHGAETPYREMVETMSEGAVTVGSDGVILYANQRFAEMVKADLRAIIGSNLLVYCAQENAASVASAFEQSADSVPRIRATLALRRDACAGEHGDALPPDLWTRQHRHRDHRPDHMAGGRGCA